MISAVLGSSTTGAFCPKSYPLRLSDCSDTCIFRLLRCSVSPLHCGGRYAFVLCRFPLYSLCAKAFMAYALFPAVTGKIAVCVYRPLFTPLLYRSRFTVVPFPCFLGESFRPKSAGTKQQMGVMITVVSLAVWLVDSKIYGHLVLIASFSAKPNHPGAGGGVPVLQGGQ